MEASHWLGWTLHYLGRLEEAQQIATQAVALAERVGAPDRFGLPNVRAVAYMVAASRGEWRPAVDAIAALVDGFASQAAEGPGFDAERESELLYDLVRLFLTRRS